ncbi:RGS20 protein, partial [Atractosteus spatula]|nr:RGS20 protein [Atractosteus spatula]
MCSSRRASNVSTPGSLQKTEESGRVSLTDVSSWAVSFNTLLESPTGRSVFMEFLRSEHSDENMLFWQACEELKTVTHKATIAERVKQIYLDYISILSPKEVSIDATVRETINKNMSAPTAYVFNDAQAQIYALMHRDSYPRFLNSPLYQSLLRSLGPAHSAAEC